MEKTVEQQVLSMITDNPGIIVRSNPCAAAGDQTR